MSGLNLIKMFEGLSPQEAKQLTARIEAVVEKEYQNFKQGEKPMDEQYLRNLEAKVRELEAQAGQQQIANWKPQQQWNGFTGQFENVVPQQQALAFDPSAAEAKIERLSGEYDRLMKNPQENFSRMEAIQKETDNLLAQIQQHNAQAQAYQRQQLQPEVDALNADIETIPARLEHLMKDPAANWQEIQILQSELDRRIERSEQIERGDNGISLQWGGQ